MNLDEKKKFIVNFSYFTICTFIIIITTKVAALYLLPFIFGIIIAFFVQKPATFISKRIKVNKNICAAGFSVIFYLFVVILFSLILWFLYSRINHFTHNLTLNMELTVLIKKTITVFLDFFKKISVDFGDTVKKVGYDAANDFILKFTDALSNVIASFIRKIPRILISVIITIVFTCYISKDYDKFKKFIVGCMSENKYKKIIIFKNILIDCSLKFLFGYFLLFLITYCELFIGLFLLRISNFIMIAFIIALVDVLPVFGTGAVLLPWSAIGFLQGNFKIGLGMILLYIAIIIVRNFIEPKIIGKQIGINPIFTLLFLFIGLRLGGIMGMILAPIIFTVVFTYYRQQLNNKKIDL